jgi:molybdenum cofactor synthesis domain-containing protein
MKSDAAKEIVTAAVLVIGDEILSGRTKDKNIGYIADVLVAVGVDLREVRVVPDIEAEIVAAVNALRARYDYLFTTGGIGPTHDDITAESVAKAFGVPITVDPRARALLLTRIAEKDLNEARLRMARIPQGADLILNKISAAPGFNLGNVFDAPHRQKTRISDARHGPPRRRSRHALRRNPEAASRSDDGKLSILQRKRFFHAARVARARRCKAFRGAARSRSNGRAIACREKNRRVKNF